MLFLLLILLSFFLVLSFSTSFHIFFSFSFLLLLLILVSLLILILLLVSSHLSFLLPLFSSSPSFPASSTVFFLSTASTYSLSFSSPPLSLTFPTVFHFSYSPPPPPSPHPPPPSPSPPPFSSCFRFFTCFHFSSTTKWNWSLGIICVTFSKIDIAPPLERRSNKVGTRVGKYL
jgi:U5 snRNP spliceosome subunit